MPYALFSNDERISRSFPTRRDCWKHAEEAGLVVDVTSDEEKPKPTRELDKDYAIKPVQVETGQIATGQIEQAKLKQAKLKAWGSERNK